MDQGEFLTTIGGVYSPGIGSAGERVQSVQLTADFPGTDSGVNTEYLVDEDSTKFNASGSWTLTCFVRPEFLESATNPRGVFSKGTSDLAATFVLGLAIHRTGANLGKAQIYYSDGVLTTSSAVTSNGSISNNTWHFIECTYNASTETLSIAIDRGTPVEATSIPENTEDLTADFRIGGTFGTGFNDFEGQISLAGFFQRILTSEELDVLYNNGTGALFASIGTAEDAVSAYIELDEVSGNRADSSGGTALIPTQPIGSSVEVPS